jgi:restriction endonuclease Mrr
VTSAKKKSYIVEIKHWRSRQKVGEKSIKDFIKVVTTEKRNGGLFLSTYGFIENAIESLTEIEREKIKFGEEEKIHSLCQTYIKRKSGLWIKDTTLTQILYDGTK